MISCGRMQFEKWCDVILTYGTEEFNVFRAALILNKAKCSGNNMPSRYWSSINLERPLSTSMSLGFQKRNIADGDGVPVDNWLVSQSIQSRRVLQYLLLLILTASFGPLYLKHIQTVTLSPSSLLTSAKHSTLNGRTGARLMWSSLTVHHITGVMKPVRLLRIWKCQSYGPGIAPTIRHHASSSLPLSKVRTWILHGRKQARSKLASIY